MQPSATHECQACLSRTIAGVTNAPVGMVLPESVCKPRNNLGHVWSAIQDKGDSL